MRHKGEGSLLAVDLISWPASLTSSWYDFWDNLPCLSCPMATLVMGIEPDIFPGTFIFLEARFPLLSIWEPRYFITSLLSKYEVFLTHTLFKKVVWFQLILIFWTLETIKKSRRVCWSYKYRKRLDIFRSQKTALASVLYWSQSPDLPIASLNFLLSLRTFLGIHIHMYIFILGWEGTINLCLSLWVNSTFISSIRSLHPLSGRESQTRGPW